MRLDNVKDVTVSGEPNALLGNIVVARVVLASPEEPGGLRKRVRKACAAVLKPYKVPAKVLIVTGDLYSPRQKKMRPSGLPMSRPRTSGSEMRSHSK
jgi:acyl-coenzyme A synthetase/AMP-(fatty) acid ligase